MVAPRFRSRTFRRIKVKTPGNRNTIHYRLRKPAKAQCGKCGRPLQGVARARPIQLRRFSRSQKSPERPFGGVLCSSCTRDELRARAK